MKFPNAFSGVKKLFAAEILQIIGVVAMGFATVFAVLFSVSVGTDNSVTGIGSLFGLSILLSGGIIVFIIAAILELAGLVKAGRDEESFKYALYMIVIGLIAVIIGSCFQTSNTTIYNICDNVNRIADLVSTIFIIQGVMNLAVNLGDDEMVAKGSSILKVIIGIYAFAIIGSITYAILSSFPVFRVISLICFCVSLLLSFISYVLFIAYLARAKKMLAE